MLQSAKLSTRHHTAKSSWNVAHAFPRHITSLANMSCDSNAKKHDQPVWRSLGTPPQQLLLHNTLPTGQSFRWRLTERETYTGVVGQRVIQLRQLQDDVQWRVLARGHGAVPDADAAVLHEYFNLDADLAAFYNDWSAKDQRFRSIAPHLLGARMLRQDPVETLFQFICSSNNHISRIHGMVERLCSTYGSELLPSSSGSCNSSSSPARQQLKMASDEAPKTPQQQLLHSDQPPARDITTVPCSQSYTNDAAALPFDAATGTDNSCTGLASPALATALTTGARQPMQQQPSQPQLAFYAFPTLQQLSAATEEALRADGFGYRAKFIVGSVQQLLSKPEGGEAWLLDLRNKPYAEAHEALCTLPGIGPKVAACICLFSLDKHGAIPVDTHVWTLATKYYAPHLAKKTLNKKLHDEIQQAFVARFGPYAGWAHNTLFISELASHKHLLPPGSAAAADTVTATVSSAKANVKRAQGRKRSAGVTQTVEASIAAGSTVAPAEAASSVVDIAIQPKRHSSRTRRRTSRYMAGGSSGSETIASDSEL